MQQVIAKQRAGIKFGSILERLDDVIIAEVIAERFQGPFISGRELEKRIDMLASKRKSYVSSRISSPRSR